MSEIRKNLRDRMALCKLVAQVFHQKGLQTHHNTYTKHVGHMPASSFVKSNFCLVCATVGLSVEKDCGVADDAKSLVNTCPKSQR